MDKHQFKPSRPDGSVCVAERRRRSSTLDDSMPCGYPAGHPIHGEPNDSEGPGPGDPLYDVNIVRGGWVACVPDTDPAWRTTLDALDRIEAALRRAGHTR